MHQSACMAVSHFLRFSSCESRQCTSLQFSTDVCLMMLPCCHRSNRPFAEPRTPQPFPSSAWRRQSGAVLQQDGLSGLFVRRLCAVRARQRRAPGNGKAAFLLQPWAAPVRRLHWAALASHTLPPGFHAAPTRTKHGLPYTTGCLAWTTAKSGPGQESRANGTDT